MWVVNPWGDKLYFNTVKIGKASYREIEFTQTGDASCMHTISPYQGARPPFSGTTGYGQQLFGTNSFVLTLQFTPTEVGHFLDTMIVSVYGTDGSTLHTYFLDGIGIASTSAVEDDQSVSVEGHFLDVSPNPLITVSAITFKTVMSGHISIVVYDATGMKVAELVNDYRPAGEYRTLFDASRLLSGAYFVRMYSDGKMNLVPIVIAQ